MKLKQEMEVFAIQARIETLKALGHLGFGHVGGAFSIADLVAVLYNGVMKVDPKTLLGKTGITWCAPKATQAPSSTPPWR